MEQSPPREANSHSAIQKILSLLWNLKFHNRVHNSPPLVPILCQMQPFHTFPPYFPKIHSNIIFPSTPTRESNTLFLLIFQVQAAKFSVKTNSPEFLN
jgi:hypothetical protein